MSEERTDYGEQAFAGDRETVKTPAMYRVLLHNDDYTTMDFVVEVLKRFFQKPEPEAMHIMLSVHHRGVGTAGVYTYEIAEMKAHQVQAYAREHEHPLRCSVEAA